MQNQPPGNIPRAKQDLTQQKQFSQYQGGTTGNQYNQQAGMTGQYQTGTATNQYNQQANAGMTQPMGATKNMGGGYNRQFQASQNPQTRSANIKDEDVGNAYYNMKSNPANTAGQYPGNAGTQYQQSTGNISQYGQQKNAQYNVGYSTGPTNQYENQTNTTGQYQTGTATNQYSQQANAGMTQPMGATKNMGGGYNKQFQASQNPQTRSANIKDEDVGNAYYNMKSNPANTADQYPGNAGTQYQQSTGNMSQYGQQKNAQYNVGYSTGPTNQYENQTNTTGQYQTGTATNQYSQQANAGMTQPMGATKDMGGGYNRQFQASQNPQTRSANIKDEDVGNTYYNMKSNPANTAGQYPGNTGTQYQQSTGTMQQSRTKPTGQY